MGRAGRPGSGYGWRPAEMALPDASGRLACLSFPHLALVLAWRAHPELKPEPVLVSGADGSGRVVVVAASWAATNKGVRPGQDLNRATTLCPLAARVTHAPRDLAELRQQARLALAGLSPLMEWADDSQAYVDLSGNDPRLAQPGQRAAACGRALQATLGLSPQVGVGPSRFSAWVAAQRAAPGRVHQVPLGRVVEFLASWPVTRLPIPEEIQERLLQFGLTTCGDCAVLTPAELQRQFGPDGIRLHRLCRGLDGAAIDPWREEPACGVRRTLAGGVEDSEALRFGARELARGLAQELRRQGRAAGRIRLVLRAEDGSETHRDRQLWWGEVAPSLPMASVEELLGPLLGLFRRARPPLPVGVVELDALDLLPEPGRQFGLWQGRTADPESVQREVDRLHDRFGKGLVWRIEVRPGHPGDLPEERLAWRAG